jgi:hypothetical protein
MTNIDELFKEGWHIAEHVGMTEEDPNRRYETREDKEGFIRTLLDYIFWLNEKILPIERAIHPKINQEVVDYCRRAENVGV